VYNIVSAVIINKLSRREVGTIYTMDVSQEDAILAIGYENNKVEILDLVKFRNEPEDLVGESTGSNVSKYLLASYKTKQSPVLLLKFTYENLLMAVSQFILETK